MDAHVPAGLKRSDGRRFGFMVGGAFLALAVVLGAWRHRPVAAAIAAASGALLLLGAVLAPRALVPVERGWMRMAGLLSKVTTPIAMAVIYYLVVTPVGLVMRLVGRRPLVHRERDGSYWSATATPGGRSDLTRQF